MAKKNFYAVRRGRKPGIYTAWPDCKAQVDGFMGARYKGFMTKEEALAWLVEDDAPRAGAGTRKAPAADTPVGEADYVIYTDGSCLRNPEGSGGWACVIREVATGKVTEKSGGAPSTTNNRMEMSAVIAALSHPEGRAKIALYTDSQYVKRGLTEWLAGWKRRGWKKSTGEDVLNQDLWRELDALNTRHDVEFHWVKGHVGVKENERCDALAKSEAMKYGK